MSTIYIIGTCTYCGKRKTLVRQEILHRRKGMSGVFICNDPLCETAFKIDPLGYSVFEHKLDHGISDDKSRYNGH